jgi:eukaryotic-like serine/threonine-protein kinase
MMDHRGLLANFPLKRVGRLQLGEAFQLAGDTEKARNSYKYFLTLWKDADSDIPILKKAKVEYAKLP